MARGLTSNSSPVYLMGLLLWTNLTDGPSVTTTKETKKMTELRTKWIDFLTQYTKEEK